MARYIPIRYKFRKTLHTKLDLDALRTTEYHFGMNALKHYRTKAGLTQQALATAVGTSQPQIRRLEASHRKLTKGWAMRLAPHLGIAGETLLFPPEEITKEIDNVEGMGGIDVIGEVAAGRYLAVETVIDESIYGQVPITPDPAFPRQSQYGLVVKGTSINRIAIDGDILHCIDIATSGVSPQNGDLVIVEQIQFAGHLVERTAKIYRADGKGSIELLPDSDDEKWQDPIYVPNNVLDWRSREDLQITLKAIVIGIYRPLQRRARIRR